MENQKVVSQKSSELESLGKKMLELMKIREKRKVKDKFRWKTLWWSISCVFLTIGCNWLCKELSEQPKEAQWLTKLMKFCYTRI